MRWLALCALPLGCVHWATDRAKYTDDTGTGGDTGTATDAPAPDGCVAGDGPASGVTAVLTDIPTVVRVTWDAAADGYVSFTTSTGPLRTPTSGPGHHEALLVGNRARMALSYRVISTDGADVWCGTPGTTTTGSLDAALPELDLTTDPALAGAPVYTVVPVFDAEDTWLTILDPEGAYVWAWRDTLLDAPQSPKMFRAALSDASDGVLGNHEANGVDNVGTIVGVTYDGVTDNVAMAQGIHTDFVQLGDGGYAMLGWEIQEIDNRKFLGDTIVEVDSDGQPHIVWSAFDWFTPDLSISYPKGFYHEDPEVEDWTHVNGIDYDRDQAAYYVSIPVNNSIARVDRATGQLTWDLADTGGDFTPVGSDTLVTMPHSVQSLGGSILVFNRGPLDETGYCSFADEIAYDAGTATAERVWSFTSPDCLHVPFLGDARRLADGSTMIVWTSSGRIDRASADGDLTWQVNLKLGAAFGFANFVESLYPPV